ncbi:MAG: potassium transporter TrkG, partial [Gammaproteobacteria bacterium]
LLGIPTLRYQPPEHIQVNEALVIVALAFVTSPLFMLYPMHVGGLSLLDTFFEAVSGITTTGLTTISDIETKPPSFLFARAWMQWYGGLGIVVLSIALLTKHQFASRRLTESSGSNNLATTARTHARTMLGVYFTISLLGFVVLFALTGDGFVALTHLLTSVSTGGFSIYNNSLAGFQTAHVAYAVIGLAVLGAIPLPAYHRAVRGNWRDTFSDIEIRALLILGLVSTVILTWLIYRTHQWGFADAAGHALLVGFSAQTGAGFSSLNIDSLDSAAKAVLMASMFVGGGVGSTTGGIKLLRLLILLRLIQVTLQRTAMPSHAVNEPRLGDKTLDADDAQRALILIVLFLIVIVLSWLIFLVFGYPALDSLFEVVSATCTVGLSTGVTHTELHPVLKMVLCIDMLLGRLEIVALLVVLYPSTWFGKRMKT